MSNEARRCKTCRWWDAHSGAFLMGDCRAPGDHRYAKVPLTDSTGSIVSFAMLDSFGAEETRYDFTCGAWRRGQEDGVLYLDPQP